MALFCNLGIVGVQRRTWMEHLVIVTSLSEEIWATKIERTGQTPQEQHRYNKRQHQEETRSSRQPRQGVSALMGGLNHSWVSVGTVD